MIVSPTEFIHMLRSGWQSRQAKCLPLSILPPAASAEPSRRVRVTLQAYLRRRSCKPPFAFSVETTTASGLPFAKQPATSPLTPLK